MTCLVVRKGYRGRGLTYPLARATIDYANERGARALEAYPMITQPGKEITWGELHVGARQVFTDAGFMRRMTSLQKSHTRFNSTGQREVHFEPASEVLDLAIHCGGHGLVEGHVLVDRVDPQHPGLAVGGGVELPDEPVAVQDR